MNNLFTWMNDEMNERGWSYAELARRSGLSPSTISLTNSGRNSATWDFCLAIANAFGEPPENVFRIAGLLPEAARGETLENLIVQAKYLNAENLETLTMIAGCLYKKQRR